jgi:sodium transport system ATP-binding protein
VNAQATGALVCDGLAKHFNLSRGRRVEAVKGVSFEVREGEIYGLLGPNGAGKTTLLRMLATIITPTAGRALVQGIDTREDPAGVRGRIGFLSGNTRLYGRLTPVEVLHYFGRLYGMADAAIEQRVDQLVSLLGMAEYAHRRCDSLSTGQTQRVSIARVLVHDPPVLILDEPTLGLDIMTSSAILDFIAGARDRGQSVIFSTHYMTEAELLCDRIGLIHEGRLLDEGRQEELYARSGATNLKDAFLSMTAAADAEKGAPAQ